MQTHKELLGHLQANIQDTEILEESLKKVTTKKSSSPREPTKRTSTAKKPKKSKINLLSKSLAKEKWGQIQTDMSKAINYWDDIAKKYEGKPTHDEKQMQEIKRLLKDLQKKLSHFG